MPKIEMSRKDLLTLAGLEDMTDDKLEESLAILKGELDSSEGDTLKIELNDTNRPDLWSVEGVARALRCSIRGREDHLRDLPEPVEVIEVDPALRDIRPFIAGFIARGWVLSEEALEALVNAQEKLAGSFGKQRKTAAIGFYRLDEIRFPVQYRAAQPDISFVPLGEETEFTLEAVLKNTETGRKYAGLLSAESLFPLLEDSSGSILSFPPVINSQTTGRLRPRDSLIFCEVTGTDWHTVQLTATILACNLEDRGASIEPVRVVYPFDVPSGSRNVITPVIYGDSLSISTGEILVILGFLPDDHDLVECLNRMDYAACSLRDGILDGVLPPYRHDGIHRRDLVEDVAIARGLNTFEPLLPDEFTVGRSAPIENLCDSIREILVGACCEEILRPVLGSSEKISSLSSTPELPVAIKNPMTAEYGVVRNSLLPGLLEVESISAHAAYPHRIFEIGEVLVREADGFCRTDMLSALLICGNAIDFGDAHSILGAVCHARDAVLSLDQVDDPRFIPGRAASVVINEARCGIIGEYHPSVVTAWGITRPVSGFEIRTEALRG